MEVQLEISVSLVWLGAIGVLRNERVSKDSQSHVKKNHRQTEKQIEENDAETNVATFCLRNRDINGHTRNRIGMRGG